MILTERFGMRKVRARMVPCILTDDQKQKRVEACNANLEKKFVKLPTFWI
jgi:hypothetical protein